MRLSISLQKKEKPKFMKDAKLSLTQTRSRFRETETKTEETDSDYSAKLRQNTKTTREETESGNYLPSNWSPTIHKVESPLLTKINSNPERRVDPLKLQFISSLDNFEPSSLPTTVPLTNRESLPKELTESYQKSASPETKREETFAMKFMEKQSPDGRNAMRSQLTLNLNGISKLADLGKLKTSQQMLYNQTFMSGFLSARESKSFPEKPSLPITVTLKKRLNELNTSPGTKIELSKPVQLPFMQKQSSSETKATKVSTTAESNFQFIVESGRASPQRKISDVQNDLKSQPISMQKKLNNRIKSLQLRMDTNDSFSRTSQILPPKMSWSESDNNCDLTIKSVRSIQNNSPQLSPGLKSPQLSTVKSQHQKTSSFSTKSPETNKYFKF